MYRRSFRYYGGDARIRVVGLTTHWLPSNICRTEAVVAVQCWPSIRVVWAETEVEASDGSGCDSEVDEVLGRRCVALAAWACRHP
jgi:hypothetical protein